MGNDCSTIAGKKGRTNADLGEEVRTAADQGNRVLPTPDLLLRRLHGAVRADDHDLARKLIADGAPVDSSSFLGYTPLHRAAHKGSVGMVQLLVAEGADKDALDAVGETPLVVAVINGDHAVVEALLAAGADASHRWEGLTPLDLAAVGHVRLLSALVRHGVDVNDADRWGTTALHRAARENRPDVVDILVMAGADTEARNDNGFTPLHNASILLGLEAAIALLQHGAFINAGNKFEQTPLHVAALQGGRRGAAEMVDILLKRGADETATDDAGRTPADVAGRLRSVEEEIGGVERVRKLLRNAPADRAWRRRGLLVASRARPQMVMLSTTSTQPPGEFMNPMRRALELGEEGVFRAIMGYL